MNFYCTHSDKNYLVKGLTLYKSLLDRTKHPFTLFYLCSDDESYDILQNLVVSQPQYEHIQPVALRHIFTPDELHRARNLPASNYGDQYSQFCWTLTPVFIHHLLTKVLKRNTHLTYFDADLFFYHSPEIIFEVCANYNVGIHKHRFTGTYDPKTNDVGEFNVGCVYFKNNTEGIKVSTWWKNCLLDPSNAYYKQYGTCGDQKYLDLFIPLFNIGDEQNICVFDDDSRIGHGAPWNFGQYGFPTWASIKYKGIEQPLLFNHFSHFVLKADGWQSSYKGEWKPEDWDPEIKKYYEHYYKQLLLTKENTPNL